MKPGTQFARSIVGRAGPEEARTWSVDDAAGGNRPDHAVLLFVSDDCSAIGDSFHLIGR